ncbi:hypothetical protein [Blastopirellula marina]|uniref:hypothetical protein n=1 Tax=Blastopirellula marina TaxID=124 RepID=UPI0011B0B528|nr:hypothetical protein [Blastopirellula marina]
MTNKRHAARSSKRSGFGTISGLLRAVALEGLGIAVFASLVGYPLMTQCQSRVSCLDTQPSVIDAGMHMLLAKIGLVHDRD